MLVAERYYDGWQMPCRYTVRTNSGLRISVWLVTCKTWQNAYIDPVDKIVQRTFETALLHSAVHVYKANVC